MRRNMAAKKAYASLIESIPPIICLSGCVDCCCPVPFTAFEWRRVPASMKANLDVRVLQTTSGTVWMAFRPGFLPENLDTSNIDMGQAMQGYNREESPGSCPFARPGTGCAIYAVRPLMCRLFGVVDHGLMRCLRGIVPDKMVRHEQALLVLAAFYGW